MKVLIIPSWYATEDQPNNGIFFKEQAQALAAAGLEVYVIYPDLRFRLGELKKGLYRVPGEPVPTYLYRRRTLTPFSERGRRPQIRFMLGRLYAAALRDWGRPDIVHLHSCRIGIETLGLCAKNKLPLVCTEHYSGVTRRMSLPLTEEFMRTLQGCSRAVAVSDFLAAFMRPCRSDTVIIPNMVDMGRFRIQEQKRENFVFAAMGNLIPVKGYDLLLRAFAKAYPELPGARLVIAGAGPQLVSLQKLSVSLGIGGLVEFYGAVPREKAPEFFSGCDCLVCSSHNETFGMTLIEALACGKPVISTMCGGPQSIVTPRNGILVKENDPDALSKAMKDIFANRARYDGELIRESCAESFGTESVTARLIRLYQSVLAGSQY